VHRVAADLHMSRIGVDVSQCLRGVLDLGEFDEK
jgi:hypothetical protein